LTEEASFAGFNKLEKKFVTNEETNVLNNVYFDNLGIVCLSNQWSYNIIRWYNLKLRNTFFSVSLSLKTFKKIY
jgi:hypothetical protein